MNGAAAATTQNEAERSRSGKEISKEVVIALLGVLLTLLFEFISLAILDNEAFHRLKWNQAEQAKLFSVHFDLYMIAFTIVLSSRAKNSNLVAFVVAIGLLFGLLAFSLIAPEQMTQWVRIWIPDMIGLGLIWFAVYTVRRR